MCFAWPRPEGSIASRSLSLAERSVIGVSGRVFGMANGPSAVKGKSGDHSAWLNGLLRRYLGVCFAWPRDPVQ